MADSKKYNGSTWLHSLRKLGTATDTIATLPANLYADGQTIGVNILNPSSTVEVNGTTKTGQTFSAGTYYIYNGKSMVAGFVNYIDDGESPSVIHLITNDEVVTSTGNLTVYVDSGSTEKVMVAKSSTAVPFQPYSNCTIIGNMSQTGTPTPSSPIQPSETGDLETSGAKAGQYKIPISSASTTTPVYLGQVQTTRKIYKFILDGTEDWKVLSSDNSKYYLTYLANDYLRADSQITYMCTHYIPYEQTVSATLVPNLKMSMSSGTAQRLYIADANFASADQFKTYLQQQYANGTPVTVWYVLSSATTGIVNEPLRKIGDYADEVSGISIPTITGKDTFDVQTALKPSEVELTYTGWHNASVKEWDGTDWQ